MSATAVCVLGMHRSGTSAITGVLHALGAYLGPEAHLMKTRADNPVGFFEHQLLTDLNDELLWALGGNWLEPPALDPGWETDSQLDDLRERGRRLLQDDFGSAPFWCWKDPRISLTLPFWRPMLPRPRYVICLRHPMEVAQSLQTRDGFSLEKGLDLWLHYMTEAVRGTCDSDVLIVAYEDLVDGTEDEIQRIAAFVGRPAADLAASARAHIAENLALRHHRAELADAFQATETSYAVSAFYTALRCVLALQRHDDWRPILHVLADASNAAHVSHRRLEGVARELRLAAQDLQQAITDHETTLTNQRRTILEQSAIIEERDAALAASSAELLRLHGLIQHLETPLGAFKVGVRSMLPSRLHNGLRAWARRVLPRLLRR